MLPPPEANPRMTANPDPPSASRPAPPAVNFNMSRRVNRASYSGSMLEHPPKKLGSVWTRAALGGGRDNRSVSRARRARIPERSGIRSVGKYGGDLPTAQTGSTSGSADQRPSCPSPEQPRG